MTVAHAVYRILDIFSSVQIHYVSYAIGIERIEGFATGAILNKDKD